VGTGTAEVVSGRVVLHGVARGLHGFVAGGDGGVGVVVGADEEARGLAGDGRGGGGAVGAGGVVAGFVSHGEGEVGRELGRLGRDAEVSVADGSVVALIAADAPRGLGGDGEPVDTHGVKRGNEGIVLNLGAAVGEDSVGAAPDAEPDEVQDGKGVRAAHGGDKAAQAKVSVEASEIKDLGEVGAQLKGVQSEDAVERERAGRESMAGAAGQVGEMLAWDARAGDVAQGGHLGRGECGRRERPEQGVNSGVPKLAVGEAKLRAGVEGGEGGGGGGGVGLRRGQVEVAALEVAENRAAGVAEENGVAWGRVGCQRRGAGACGTEGPEGVGRPCGGRHGRQAGRRKGRGRQWRWW